MEENKSVIKNILPEIFTMLILGAGICGYCYWDGTSMILTLRNVVMFVLGIAIVGFLYRQEYVTDGLDYDNNEHPLRFWATLWCGALISVISIFLPIGGWPFMPVYVMLSLFSNMYIGVLAASVLLMMSVLLTDAAVGVFFLYFISGVFAASLFRHLKNEFTIGMPWFLSMLCLMVCETANIVLTANERLNFEQFLVPAANLIVSSVLLLGIIKIFSDKVIYKYREFYLEWNDTENEVLADYKQKDKKTYFTCVHTAYFCERIAKRLNLDADAMKCVGYYHKMVKDFNEHIGKRRVPPTVTEVLTEFHDDKMVVSKKETAVLVYSDAIVSSIMFLLSKNKDGKIDYDHIIDTIFKKIQDDGTFKHCNITMQELDTMQKIFKEDKLYYDFLRGE